MNVHHLELFYYVAKHKGVSAAARKIPYGIQQPAISAQILQLEDSLGSTLFHRRPFSLTKAGSDLFEYIEPFFDGLQAMGKKLRGGVEARLRIGAPETIQREYLPRVLRRVKKRLPELTLTLFSGRLEEVEQRLLSQDLDLGLASLHGKRSEGIKSREILQVPLVLLVPERSGITKAESFFQRERMDIPLISLPASDPLYRFFQESLRGAGIEWYPSLELNSLELVGRYVAEGFGAGLSLAPPAMPLAPGCRALPLKGFPSVPFGALWVGNLTPVAAAVVEELTAFGK
jgi:DNA-binding transcriptional LysR family regulator